MTHYLSHKDIDLIQMFNHLYKRDFFSNTDYERVGGQKDDVDSDYQDIDDPDHLDNQTPIDDDDFTEGQ